MTGISGLGTDVVRISRFRRILEEHKQGVLDRLFHGREQAYALAKKDPAPHLAVRFAAKEAFLKALGTGLADGIRWLDLEIVRDERGKPDLLLQGRAEELFRAGGHGRLHLSCSHDGDYALATVILEKSR
jgi:holo-[acyl-carrier protein] synthase